MRATWGAAMVAVVMLLAAACSSPPAKFYALNSTAASGPPAAPGLTVSVGPVQIPAIVDRPQMVLDAGDNQVKVDELNRWAAPLADQITRVTVDNLSRLLGAAEVWPSTAPAAARASVKVAIDVQALRSVPGRSVLLDARWSVRRGDAFHGGRTRIDESVTGAGADALAAAHSRALAQLAAQIAQAIGRI